MWDRTLASRQNDDAAPGAGRASLVTAMSRSLHTAIGAGKAPASILAQISQLEAHIASLEAELAQLPNLLHGEETRLYGDSAYRDHKQRERLSLTVRIALSAFAIG